MSNIRPAADPLTSDLQALLSDYLMETHTGEPMNESTLYRMAVDALDWMEEMLGGLHLVPQVRLVYHLAAGRWRVTIIDAQDPRLKQVNNHRLRNTK